MKIAITGGSGLIGAALASHLRGAGHDVIRLERARPEDGGTWDPEAGWIAPHAFDGVEGVIHLSGASIGDGRWTARRKRLLRASRLDSTRLLVQHFASRSERPRVLLCASAVGYYGDRGDAVLTEAEPRGGGFLAGLVEDWEAEAGRAEALGMRMVHARTGIVLAKDGGALPRMLLPFRLGVGGRLGSGRQWMPWVTLRDEVRALEFALTHDAVRGPMNIAAPAPVTNREFTRALGQVLRRPTVFPAPAFALRLLLGEAADELLLYSIRAVPAALQRAGFEFEDADLRLALARVLELPSARLAASGA